MFGFLAFGTLIVYLGSNFDFFVYSWLQRHQSCSYFTLLFESFQFNQAVRPKTFLLLVSQQWPRRFCGDVFCDHTRDLRLYFFAGVCRFAAYVYFLLWNCLVYLRWRFVILLDPSSLLRCLKAQFWQWRHLGHLTGIVCWHRRRPRVLLRFKLHHLN